MPLITRQMQRSDCCRVDHLLHPTPLAPNKTTPGLPHPSLHLPTFFHSRCTSRVAISLALPARSLPSLLQPLLPPAVCSQRSPLPWASVTASGRSGKKPWLPPSQLPAPPACCPQAPLRVARRRPTPQPRPRPRPPRKRSGAPTAYAVAVATRSRGRHRRSRGWRRGRAPTVGARAAGGCRARGRHRSAAVRGRWR
ncbi:hypothetical protein I4F81_001571 [Pyropia yezoensis]|uniref:Uncharacterized protein n=1 Tax=Pyropia yezoensis TaxID=2788 RepID=A0ACC3BNA5_PYRYE|nr:hypothetical protein I4F81_001571 [Neopyropia yezoensis]